MCWKFNRLRTAKTILKKNSKVGRLILHDFKIHYKATAINALCYLYKYMHISQWKRTEIIQWNILSFWKQNVLLWNYTSNMCSFTSVKLLNKAQLQCHTIQPNINP